MTVAAARTTVIEVRELTRRFGAFTAVDAITFDVAATVTLPPRVRAA